MPIKTSKKKFKPKKRSLADFGGTGGARKTKKKKAEPPEEKRQEAVVSVQRVEIPPQDPQEEATPAPLPVKTLQAAPEPVIPTPQPSGTNPLQETYGDIYAALNAAAELEDQAEDGTVPNPVDLMNLAISADLDPSIFTEQSFPVAENVIDWCRSAKFLGFSGELRPKQYEILSRFFGDVCYLCSDAAYIHNVPVDDDINNVIDRFVLLQCWVMIPNR